ncbi:MAG: hypothetical protein KBA33_04815 [Cloacibacterium sp.]|nr:hypothetical protein [Cloacibacterium sp.]
MKRLYLLLVFLTNLCFSQDQLTYRLDRFSGVNGVIVDPTHSLVNDNHWDANIISVGTFLQNNYVYLNNSSVITAMQSDGFYTQENTPAYNPDKNYIQMGFNRNQNFYENLQVEIQGPSFAWRQKIKERDYAIGAFSRARSMVSGMNMDQSFGYDAIKTQLPSAILAPEYTVKASKINMANWAEIGLNLATRINENPFEQWLFGTNLKFLLGYDAAMLNIPKSFEVSVSDQDFLMKNYQVDAMATTAYNFDTQTYDWKKNNGLGGSIDIGISFVKNKYKTYRDQEFEYDDKFSAALLDLGFISFKGENHTYRLNAQSLINFDTFQQNTNSLQDFFAQLSQTIYGNPDRSRVSDSFKIGMPTSLMLNFDSNFYKNHHLNFSFFQRIPVFENSLRRPNIFSVSYSIQKNALSYGVSTSLYEYQSLRFGGYLRLGPLFLGSENILPIFFKHQKLQSFDFYIGLKLFPFWDNLLKKRQRQKCNC